MRFAQWMDGKATAGAEWAMSFKYGKVSAVVVIVAMIVWNAVNLIAWSIALYYVLRKKD